jgi:YHS domain-containing protein
VAIMFTTMVVAALAVHGLFSAFGLVPTERPSIDSITERPIAWNYTTWLNIVFTLVTAALVALTMRHGAKDPVCGMTVDKAKTPHLTEFEGRTYYFCGAGCKRKFDAEPGRYTGSRAAEPLAHTHH